MTDRFASLKNNPTTNMNKFQSKPIKRNSRFDSLSSVDTNNDRFASNTFKRKPFNRRNQRRNNRDISNNKTWAPNQIGKFSQVCTGEVVFTPQAKSKKMSQKERKNKRKQEKLKVLDKKEDNADWDALPSDADLAVTLAMAQQYQYFTESEEEEEEEEGENNEVEEDNSAW